MIPRNRIEKLRENNKGKKLKRKKPTFNQIGFTKFDKERNQIPLREVFISLQLLKETIKSNTGGSVQDIMDSILSRIAKDSYDILDLQLHSSKQDNTKLAIIDRNFVPFMTTEVDFFEKLFTFKPMSKNSIVKSYDLSISTPKGELQSMIAIQSLPTGKSLFPLSQITDKYLGLHYSYQEEAKRDGKGTDIGVTYLPNMGSFQTDKVEEDNALARKISYNFIEGDMILSPDENNETKNTLDKLSVTFGGGSRKEFDDALEARDNPRESVKDGTIGSEGNISQDEFEEVSKSQWTASTISEYYGFLARKNNIDKIPTILPATLSLTIYGISSLVPGDIFKIDYLPERQRKLIYFQIIKITQNINQSTWSTTLETVPRIRPENKEDSGLYFKPDMVVINPKIFTTILDKDNYIFGDLRYMTELKYSGKGTMDKLDYNLVFKVKENKNPRLIYDYPDERKLILKQNAPQTYNFETNDFKFKLIEVGDFNKRRNQFFFTYEFEVNLKEGELYDILIKDNEVFIIPHNDGDSYTRIEDFLGLFDTYARRGVESLN